METEAHKRAEARFTQKAEREADASAAMKEHKAKEAHVDANMVRLRDLRLARESQIITPPPPKKKAKAKPKVRRAP